MTDTSTSQVASGEIMAGMALAEPRRLDLTAAYASARDRAARAAADPYNEVKLSLFLCAQLSQS